ncbi:MAG: hypothetical protein IKJ83_01910 [Ruminococcus sp.]|nr:hypothetical protein [Ruminococcus sp.]
MKNCPFCKAEIEDNSSFCLYCMTPIEEKQAVSATKYKDKRKVYIPILIILLAVLLIIGIIIFTSNNNSGNSIPSSATQDEVASSTAVITEATAETLSVSTSPVTGNNISASDPVTTQSKTDSVHTTQGQVEITQKATQPPIATDAPTQSTPIFNNTTFTYRQAKYGDDFYVHYPITDNDIVITGVKSPAPDGKYIIPSTIDGKNVLAVTALAFSDESIAKTVKQVVVPSNIKTIWNDAFAGCFNMTDIYLWGNSIYIESGAFVDASKRNGTLTIHCSADCQDRNLRYYKSSASYYKAEYKEWNGGELN